MIKWGGKVFKENLACEEKKWIYEGERERGVTYIEREKMIV